MRPQPPQCSPTGLQTASVWDTNLPHVPLQKGAKGELQSCQQGLLLAGAAELMQHPEGAAPEVSSIFGQLAFMLCVLLAHGSVWPGDAHLSSMVSKPAQVASAQNPGSGGGGRLALSQFLWT